MKNHLKYFLLTLVSCVYCSPRSISQPAYTSNHYLSAQTQYKQPEATGYEPQYLRQQTNNRPVYDSKTTEGLQNYATQDQQAQIIVGNNVDRQVQSPNRLYNLQPSLATQAREAFAAAAQHNKYIAQPQHYQTEQYQTQPQQYVVEKPQVTQVKYVQKPVEVARRPQQYKQVQNGQREEDYDPNPSYQFGFDVKDELNSNYQNRKEQREGNKITGSYSVVDSDGFIRTVSYTADPKEGFKAEVSRQPTDIVVKVPKPLPQYQNPKQKVQYVQVPVPQREQAEDHRQPANVVYQYQ